MGDIMKTGMFRAGVGFGFLLWAMLSFWAMTAVPQIQMAQAAPASDDFKQLATALGDAVIRADDGDTLEMMARLRALNVPLGNEINFAEGQALMRMHRNDAATVSLTKYMAGKGSLKKRAQAMLDELKARQTLLDQSWRREEPLGPIRLTYPDGSHIAASSTGEDLGYSNAVSSFVDARGVVQWRSVLGGASGAFFKAGALLEDGQFVMAGSTYGPAPVERTVPATAAFVRYDALGRVVWQRNIGSSSGKNAYGTGVLADGKGGMIVSYTLIGAQDYIERLDGDGKTQWRYIPPKEKNVSDDLAVMVRDDAGNIYLQLEGVDPALRVLNAQGKLLRLVKPQPPTTGFGKDFWEKYRNYSRVTKAAVSPDGRYIYLYGASRFGTSKRSHGSLYVMDTTTGAVPWVVDLGAMVDYLQGHFSFAADNKGVVVTGVVVPETGPQEGKSFFTITRYAVSNAGKIWERSEEVGSNLRSHLATVSLMPSGIMAGVRVGNTFETVFLSHTEFDAIEADPAADAPVVAFLPFSQNTEARQALLMGQAQDRLKAANARLAQCQASLISLNRVGVIREVRADWGFVVVDLDSPSGPGGDMLVQRDDGALVKLKPGKKANPRAISAIPEDNSFNQLTSGMAVVVSGDVPSSRCPAELAAMNAAQHALAGLSGLQTK
jgi:outer membrane protein assembly factor BamB